MKLTVPVVLATTLALAACGGGGSSGGPPPPGATPTPLPTGAPAAHAIKHVVIIFQENRTVDNLFNGFPGADTVQSGQNSSGQSVALQPVDISAPFDLDHSHRGFTTEYAGGAMNGFDRVGTTPCATCPAPNVRAYGFVPQSETAPYWQMARQYAFADRMFQTNEGPSFPAHQYIVSGTSLASTSSALLAAENPDVPGGASTTAGCDAPAGTTVALIDPASGDESQRAAPCFDHPVLFDLLDARGVSWRYYQPHIGAGLWYAPDAIRHIRFGADYANVSTPSTNIISDVQSGKLAQVSWVIPTAAASDHARSTDGTGPAWVASVVNAIGASAYWSDTAIFVTWDDWGGWYDHVKPQQFNAYELGFRVPLIVVSPYARSGYVSHVQHEFGSVVEFTEATFGLGTLGYTDARADDLSDCFDFTQQPIAFRTIQASRRASYFQHAPADARSPDDDF